MSPGEEFVEVYEYIQGKINSSPGYECSKRRTATSKAKVFLELHHSLTAEIFDFISFIFVLRTSEMNRYTFLPFGQFVSKNAYNLYKERTEQQCYFLRKFQLERELRNPIQEIPSLSSVYLDSQREKYFDSPRGYILCESFEGKLYDEVKCKECRYNYICIRKR